MDADGWNRLFAQKDLLFPTEPNPLIVELVSALEPSRALEVGVGEGRHAIWLAEQDWQVTAVDFSSVALDRVRRRARSSGVEMRYVLADAAEVLPTVGSFDLVLVAYMHPEPSRRDAVLAGVAGAVAAGGHLLVVGVDVADPKAAHGSDERDWRYSPELLSTAFPGIELTRCERVVRAVETEQGSGHAVDTLAWGYRPLAAPS